MLDLAITASYELILKKRLTRGNWDAALFAERAWRLWVVLSRFSSTPFIRVRRKVLEEEFMVPKSEPPYPPEFPWETVCLARGSRWEGAAPSWLHWGKHGWGGCAGD